MKRVLVYSHDTFGLGNIRRMLEIARHLVDNEPDLSVLIITGSPMLHAFRIPPRIDYVKLPCLSRNAAGGYGARYLDMDLQSTVRLRANLIRSTIADFAPDLILVDKKPFGVEEELAGALEALPADMTRPKLVLLLRDILDSPEATMRVWRKNRYFEAIDEHYDDVLVVGNAEVFDLRAEYAFPPCTADKVRFCGYIARKPGRRSRASVRAELAVTPAQPLVLVTAGGGEDGDAMISAYVEGLASLPPPARPRSHIVFGPEMAADRRDAICRLADTLDCVTRQDFSDDMMSLMDAADVVVSMGGYNTVCELLTLHKRAVVVPRVRPVQEQCIRAERMAELGLMRIVHPDRLTPQGLLQAVGLETAALRGNGENPISIRLDGLEQVGRAIFGLIGTKRRDVAPRRPQAVPSSSRSIPTWTNFAPTVAQSASW
ncbi:glycosyltransferase family protein [Aromatoleum diolicum]|uniref:Glycosyltransferase n=1 Tax=Aromatoleum diolicum TaxID=75796 RepID=A0ABX1QC70_9RHOO|nr:glycosyltransferase [Aromatoleum diolicum]NMG75568.1 glycosyltransferase [Aromatoleum diolicum]